jgi:hypothetical protein
MKKLMLVLLIALSAGTIFAANRIFASQEPEYDIALGNGLSRDSYEINNYVETLDKPLEVYDVEIPDTFELMAEDSSMELYLERDNLAIAVRVKDNGYVYSSYNFNDSFAGKSDSVIAPIKSGVTLELYKDSTPITMPYTQERPIVGGNTDIPVARSTIQALANGFIAQVDYNHPEVMIAFDVQVTLENGSLVVSVPHQSITEYNPNIFNPTEQYYLLRNIVLFPYFGSTKGVDDGYVIIPDGSGALISLDTDSDVRSTFALDVWGMDYGYRSFNFRERSLSTKDRKRVTLPVYAVVHDVSNTGFYVESMEGTNYAILNFKSAGTINDYYYTYFSYRYRESYEQYQSRTNEDQYRISFQDDPNGYDAKLRYTFVSGAEADYVGIAKRYQQDLLTRQALPEQNRTVFEQTPIKVDFIGTEITMGVLSDKLTDITTYQEMIDIVELMQSDGYNELTVALKNFDDDVRGYRFGVYRQLGGKNDFRTMLETLQNDGVEFSYYLDYVRSYSNFARYHAQTLSKREIFYIELSWMYYAHNVNNPKHYTEFAKDDIDDLNDYGIDHIALAGLDRAVYTGWDDAIILGTTNREYVEDMMQFYADEAIKTGLYNPDSYLYPYMSAYYDAPLGSSEYAVSVASIPFVQLILGGQVDMYSEYLNFASDEQLTLLRLVEFGVFPAYTFTGGSAYDVKKTNASNVYISEYSVLENRIRSYYDFLQEGLDSTINAEMIDHTYLAEGVVKVVYDNGTEIILNYNNADIVVDTTLIPAMGYVVMP